MLSSLTNLSLHASGHSNDITTTQQLGRFASFQLNDYETSTTLMEFPLFPSVSGT